MAKQKYVVEGTLLTIVEGDSKNEIFSGDISMLENEGEATAKLHGVKQFLGDTLATAKGVVLTLEEKRERTQEKFQWLLDGCPKRERKGRPAVPWQVKAIYSLKEKLVEEEITQEVFDITIKTMKLEDYLDFLG